ncbi:2-hydroxyacid dehydrogenase [Limimaricola pyoseonensis]|uniref:Glyoxylate/hydroxypyruvate reductase A n=1 Tax=Limimaricola pyoseonensis TaxID=521013 RepID=A0A1G7G3K9_9RHOB|nr:glyoxylate/hydroxypyruvate reductase A [Limimaricola pyoseonensis]SDE82687.1 glyoxylate/hydroxypyruvate reductase A [Limimaricola pyoseonensis]
MTTILFSAPEARWADYAEVLPAALKEAGVKARLTREAAPEEVDYIVFAPNDALRDFRPYTRARAVLSLWAGVETIVGNETLTQPLTRMVDDGLERGMTEYVAGHVLRHHLGMDRHIANPGREWRQVAPPLASDRPVTVLGLGALGETCAIALADLGFPVTGWSRSRHDILGLRCLSGPEGLREALSGAEIVVTLLPLTAETENLMNAERLALPARGAALINPGRGALIDDDALLAALDDGQIGHATLDVFRTEPLPDDHPYWAHPRVTVTPHVASETRPETAAKVIAENVRRSEAGEPLLHLVDRRRGY